MPAESVEVSWQVADDEAMTRVLQQGTANANAAWAHAVHVEVAGLRPDRWYWYQFKVGGDVSPKGRTRTMPAANASPERLRFAFASCQKYQTGYFTAFEHMAREELDLIVHLGDYIYEKGDGGGNPVRSLHSEEIYSLDDYRARYALYKTDPALQAAHAAAPWIVTWDDHEVSNNYASDRPQQHDRDKISQERFALRRAAAYQAYFEHQPLRRSAQPRGPEMLLYRRLAFGGLTDFHVLDTRQYRTDQPLGDGEKPDNPVLMDPEGTIMGDRQRAWLFDGLEKSVARWNVLAQQVLVARIDITPGPEVGLMMDKWSGYEFERRRLLREFHDKKITNPIVIAGDNHNHWACDLPLEPGRPDAPSVAVEFAGTSITSGGDGVEKPKYLDTLYAENPFVKYHNSERGYVTCEVTPQQWKTDFKTVPYVTKRGAPLNTRATFIVESGRPQLQRA
jgi:alkaline phosphatase D